jgi:hypothetical protein
MDEGQMKLEIILLQTNRFDHLNLYCHEIVQQSISFFYNANTKYLVLSEVDINAMLYGHRSLRITTLA